MSKLEKTADCVLSPHRIRLTLAALLVFVTLTSARATAQTTDSDQDKSFDLRSSVGDMHLGNDATSREIGLPVYPGARLRKDDDNRNSANLSLFTSAFGMKLVIANYDSDDSANKIVAFYREKLKKYGKVLECHTSEHGGDVNVHENGQEDDHDSKAAKELKCEGDNTGPVVELKAGTEDNQHEVAVEPGPRGKGATFALVYVRTRGKQADI